jgi:hypothetical protein
LIQGLTIGFVRADVVLVKLKLALVALQIVALAVVFVWIGAPGPYFAIGLAMVAWRYFLRGNRD